MIVRELTAKLGFQTDKGSEKRTESAIGKIKKAAVALAAVFATGKLASGLNNLVNGVAKLGDEIAKTSKQIGVNAQALQELQFAANLAGASNTDVTTGLRVLQKNMLEAADGTKSYVDDFNRLGVSVTDANGKLKSAEELLPELADGFQNLSTDTERTALAQTLMGRSGTKLVPLLNQGTDAINEQRKRAQELGGIFSVELLGLSEDLIDAQTEQQKAFQGLRNVIGEELIPIWIKATDFITKMAVQFREPLRRGVQAAIRVIGGLAKGMFRVGKIIVAVVDGWIELTSALTGVNKKLLITTGIVAGLVVLLGLPTVLLLAISAAILLVIDDLETMGEGGESVIGTLILGFQDLVTELGSVPDALKEILKTTVDFWLKEILGLSKETRDIITTILDPLFAVITGSWIDDAIEIITVKLPAIFKRGMRRIKNEILEVFGFETEEIEGGARRGPTIGELRAMGQQEAVLGVPPMLAAAPAARGPTVINQPENHVTINIPPTVRDPRRAASMAGRETGRALEQQNRRTLKQLDVSKGGSS
jgi:X-X-X-Leu-X-X-Gly heptad repeat protein